MTLSLYITVLLLIISNFVIYANAQDKVNKYPDYIFQWLVEQLDLFGIIAVILTIALYWYNERNELNDRLRRSYNTILRELDNHIETVNRIPLRIMRETSDNFKVDYVNAYFNTDAFTSLIYSGLLTYLKPSTQESLVNMYNYIKKHNEKLAYRNEVLLDSFLKENETVYTFSNERKNEWYKRAERHERSLSKWDNQIIEMVTRIKNDISNEKLIQDEQCKKRK